VTIALCGTIPPEIRFEGVAGGIVPQSAIVTGFPEGIVERNRDAYLLSARTLIDRSLGRRVHLRRTSRATGAVSEQDAVIRSGADGAVVLQTAAGFEALRCSGLAETLVYNEVPAGLSARPTLSVRARSSRPVAATVTLTYLSNGFDWQANYIANLSPDGTRVDLFAWLTLASMDETSFRNADTQAVAGRLNRAATDYGPRYEEDDWLRLRCWPAGRTSDLPLPVVVDSRSRQLQGMVSVGDTVNELPESGGENIVITAMRARQEELGDLKLYRIPEPVTVAAHSQKQVAFLEQPAVQVSLVYRQRLDPESEGSEQAIRTLVTRNRREEGLGVPLPAGGVQLFAAQGGRPILIGEGSIRDRAVGEDVEIALGDAPGVAGLIEEGDSGRRWRDYALTVTNDQSVPALYEVEFLVGEERGFRPRGRLARRNGRPLWAVTVPANGTATLHYRVTRRD